MQNAIKNQNLNGVQNNINKENKLMKNSIKERRAAEVAAKEAEAKELARVNRLKAVKKVDIVGTMDEVTNNTARCVRDENGNPKGTNGGKYLQEPVNINGKFVTIAAKTQEELNELKENITNNGLSGDGKFHKIVTIRGMKCECVGATLEELEADIAAAEDYAEAHKNGSVFADIDVAEQLVDAEFKKEDLEEVKLEGERFLLSYDGNFVMDLNGNTIVNLDNIKSKLSREDVKTLLLEKLTAELSSRLERGEAISQEDADGIYNDGYADGYEDGLNESNENSYDEGYDEGYKDGHEDGYDAAIDELFE